MIFPPLIKMKLEYEHWFVQCWIIEGVDPFWPFRRPQKTCSNDFILLKDTAEQKSGWQIKAFEENPRWETKWDSNYCHNVKWSLQKAGFHFKHKPAAGAQLHYHLNHLWSTSQQGPNHRSKWCFGGSKFSYLLKWKPIKSKQDLRTWKAQRS